MVLRVFGVTGADAERLSDDVCIGLQLANHAQDVSRDAAIGRRYLVDSDVDARGIAGAAQAMVERARDLLASGDQTGTARSRGRCACSSYSTEWEAWPYATQSRQSGTKRNVSVRASRHRRRPSSYSAPRRNSSREAACVADDRSARATRHRRPPIGSASATFNRDMAKREAGNFYWGFISLAVRPAHRDLRALRFCAPGRRRGRRRGARQSPGPAAPPSRARLALSMRGRYDGDPVMQACLAETVKRYSIPEAELQMLIDGVEMDFSQSPLRDVGRIGDVLRPRRLDRRTDVRPDFGFEDDAALDRADDIGIALQLTNILRDVREDAEMGRIYLPLEDLRRFGVTQESSLSGDTEPAVERSDRIRSAARARILLARVRSASVYRSPSRRLRANDGRHLRTHPREDRTRAGVTACAARGAFARREGRRDVEGVALARVAVVGAGLAGLAAALELEGDADTRSSVFERTPALRRAGDLVRGRRPRGRQRTARFPRVLHGFIAFVERVGMGGQLTCRNASTHRAARGGAQPAAGVPSLPAPLHLACRSAPTASRHRPGDWASRARCSRRAGPSVATRPSAWLGATARDAAAVRAFWEPFFIPALNAPFDRVSARRTRCSSLQPLSCAMPAPRGSDFRRFRSRTRRGRGRASRRDAHLDRGGSARGVGCRRAVALVTASAERFDAVVLAVPPRQTARMLGDPARYGLPGLDAYDPYPIVDVHLWHDGGTLGLDFAAAVGSPLQWIFEKAPGYLCCSISAASDIFNDADGRAESRRVARSATRICRDCSPRRIVRSAVDAQSRGDLDSATRRSPDGARTAHRARSRSPARGPIPAGPTRWSPPCAAATRLQHLLEADAGRAGQVRSEPRVRRVG